MIDYENIYTQAFAIGRYSSSTIAPRYVAAINSINKNNIKTVLDVSAGRGQLTSLIKEKINSCEVFSTDIFNFGNFDNEHFFRLDLTNFKASDLATVFDAVVCLDVLEHLEEKYLNSILFELSKMAKNIFISVANHPNEEILGGIPTELHLIQQPMVYWEELFDKYYNIMHQTELLLNRSFYFELVPKEEN